MKLTKANVTRVLKVAGHRRSKRHARDGWTYGFALIERDDWIEILHKHVTGNTQDDCARALREYASALCSSFRAEQQDDRVFVFALAGRLALAGGGGDGDGG